MDARQLLARAEPGVEAAEGQRPFRPEVHRRQAGDAAVDAYLGQAGRRRVDDLRPEGRHQPARDAQRREQLSRSTSRASGHAARQQEHEVGDVRHDVQPATGGVCPCDPQPSAHVVSVVEVRGEPATSVETTTQRNFQQFLRTLVDKGFWRPPLSVVDAWIVS